MESPNKRLRRSSPGLEDDADFIPFGGDDEEEGNSTQFGYGTTNGPEVDISSAPRGPRAMYHQPTNQSHRGNARNDPRNAKDRPKSKHPLPNHHEPWILVKTKFGRHFVHNTHTKESLWRIPQDLLPAVREVEQWERQQKEKEANAKWAEAQLKEMRERSKAEEVIKKAGDRDGSSRGRRRRSESLQREDEEAMMAELAAEAERKEEQDVKEVVKEVEPLKPAVQKEIAEDEGAGYGSDSSYEEVEVTDSEFEDDNDDEGQVQRRSATNGAAGQEQQQQQQQEDGPVEFGEDDIAYQLAAMNENYDYDYDDADEEEWNEENSDNEAISSSDAANIFREMLNDHQINPFTPWSTLLADESPTGIIQDPRYTILPNMRTRKQVWETWVKDTAALRKSERQAQEKRDPKVAYLAFLADKASPKLYWPEFKRKFKKETVMNDRGVSEKEKEKLYRDYIARLKLSESTRKADLITLLKSVPLTVLNKGSDVEALPQQLLAHLHYISLPPSARDQIIRKHISTLPAAPEANENDESQRGAENLYAQDRRRQAEALAERERKVEEERRRAEKQERWAKKDLRREEDELRKAMDVGDRGLREQLRG